MASSRLFVRNLPPTITEDDFRSHFSKRFPLTDIKLFPQRRIGYIGLQTPKDAEAAVKYFNKSFIRMSRIHVELATAPDVKKVPTARASRNLPSVAAQPVASDDTASAKRKRTEDDKNVEEKKRKVEKKSAPPNADKNPSGETDAVAKAGEDAEPLLEQPAASDVDWMRSKTSRLLGLEDDDDDEENQKQISAPAVEEEEDPAPAVTDSEQPSQQPTPPPDQSESTSAESAEEGSMEEDKIRESRRLFVRNLPYTTQEEDLRQLLEPMGALEEVHVPLDPKTGHAKGFAFVLFQDPEEAIAAYQKLDGTAFQGRLVHVLPAAAKRDSKLDEYAISQLPIKKQKQLQRKGQAASSTFNWNSLYMNADAVVSSIASRLGVAKSEIFDPTSADAAVKQAQAETHVIQETKAFFEQNGVDIDAFKNRERGDTAILVKNFPYGTSSSELRDLFAEFGNVSKVLLPPSGTIAIVEFQQKTQARAAFQSLAYRKFKNSMLFLEKAPKDLFTNSRAGQVQIATSTLPVGGQPDETQKLSTSDLLQARADDEQVDTSVLFVKNLNFTTSQQRFEDMFKPLDGFMSARVKTKVDTKSGNTLSMGFGFLEFRSTEQAKAAQLAMDGYTLDGHQLVIRASHKGNDAAEERRKEDKEKQRKARKSKIIIKNLPFEASQKDVRALFKSYGQLRSIRVPKKFDGSRKGFAFAEFTTPKEAENAMEALRNTHFLGRRLVLDFAAGEAEDAEKEIEAMQKKVGRQANSVALQRLTKGSERKKFTIGEGNEDGAEG